jgi:hypothetical protein
MYQPLSKTDFQFAVDVNKFFSKKQGILAFLEVDGIYAFVVEIDLIGRAIWAEIKSWPKCKQMSNFLPPFLEVIHCTTGIYELPGLYQSIQLYVNFQLIR